MGTPLWMVSDEHNKKTVPASCVKMRCRFIINSGAIIRNFYKENSSNLHSVKLSFKTPVLCESPTPQFNSVMGATVKQHLLTQKTCPMSAFQAISPYLSFKQFFKN